MADGERRPPCAQHRQTMWRVIPGQDLQPRNWDDEHVVYINLTGDTHLVSGDAMLVLLALQAQPRDEAALVAALAGGEGTADLATDSATDSATDLATIAAAVETYLDELRALSLIEHTAC